MTTTESVPLLLQQQVDRWAETWFKAKFSRLLELRAQDPGPFNYPIAVFSEWRGKAFYLNTESDLAGYDTSRGTIRFSARAGLPATLVRKLVKARIAEE